MLLCDVLLLLLLQENPQILLNLAESNVEDSAEYGEVTCERCTCSSSLSLSPFPYLVALLVCSGWCTVQERGGLNNGSSV